MSRAMKMKKVLIKALLALACAALLLTAAFALWQALDTAQVETVLPVRGRLRDEIPLEGEVYFKESDAYSIPLAAKLNLYVEEVRVRPGSRVQPGDVLFTASVPGYEAELEKLMKAYREAVAKYSEKSAAGLHFGQSSPHNDYYNAMIHATENYWEKLYRARTAALAAGQELPANIADWKAGLSGTRDKALEEAVREALSAKEAMDGATATLKSIYEEGKPVPRLGDAYFAYIKELDGLKDGVYEQLRVLMDFERKVDALKMTKAEAGGYVTELNVKEGEGYDGSKPAYRLSAAGEKPLIRCETSHLTKELRTGLQAGLPGGGSLSVVSTEKTPDGKTWAYLEPDEELLKTPEGVERLMEKKQALRLRYEAEETATLLPAGALHLDGDGRYFVWTARKAGGLLPGLSADRAARQEVTVLETSQDMAAVREELTGLQVLYRENKALHEGRRVRLHDN